MSDFTGRHLVLYIAIALLGAILLLTGDLQAVLNSLFRCHACFFLQRHLGILIYVTMTEAPLNQSLSFSWRQHHVV